MIALGRGRTRARAGPAIETAAVPPPPEAEGRRPGEVVVLPLEGVPYLCHVGTTNESWLRLSRLLLAEGVRNNKFMLALFDGGLADVDPRSPTLTEEEQARVLVEIVRNPWYFWREVVCVPVPGGKVRFELHLGNLFQLWCMCANLNSFLILPRQTYKTVSACCFYMWAYCFGTSNSHILFFNKELADSKNNLKRLKDLVEELPAWVREGVLRDPVRDFNNMEYIQSGHRHNRIDAKASGKDPEHADLLGRGATVPLTWYDEMAFAKYIEETYSAAAPAGIKAKESAAFNGRPYGTCVTTTPSNLDSPSAEFAFRLKTGALQFRLPFYDYGPARVREMIDSEAEFPFLAAEYTWRQLGKDDAWYRAQCRELLNNRTKIKRELDLVWPLSGEGSVFEEEQLDVLRTHEHPIVGTIPIHLRGAAVPNGLEIQFCEVPDPNRAYLVGVDTASGEGRDYTTFVFCDPTDTRAVGSLRTNTTDPEALRALAKHILVDLFPNAIAVIERNYLGIALIGYLLHEGLENRLFYLVKEKVAERTVGAGRALRTRQRVRVYGVNTDTESREAMIRHLFQVVDELPHLVQLRAIQDEIRTLQRKRNGKVEHRANFHDDVVFGFLLVLYADRHDQPVLRRMSRTSAGQDRAAGAALVTAMNVPGAPPAAAQPAAGGPSPGLTLQDYINRDNLAATDENTRRRRNLAASIAALNTGGELPV
jgi:hypothetical protein